MKTQRKRPWETEFRTTERDERVDLVSRDGTTAVEFQDRPQGLRGLYSGVMRLALYCVEKPSLRRACLVINANQLSKERLAREWSDIKKLFASQISNRLCLIAFGEKEWIDPDDAELQSIANLFQKFPLDGVQTQRRIPRPRYFEIAKVLLVNWLQKRGPIPVSKLKEMAGCTHPTIREAVRRLDQKQYIRRQSDRSVELTRFPDETWNELVALSPMNRRSIPFVDTSGDQFDPHRLVRRLSALKVPRVAVSGVEAARFWDPEFDLHGTPRLDLILHSPDGAVDLGFIDQLDPALMPANQMDQSPILVVHPLWRPEPLFTVSDDHELPFADPVETALDLLELGLVEQTGQLFAHFRPDARLR
jgi:hypothetical protein